MYMIPQSFLCVKDFEKNVVLCDGIPLYGISCGEEVAWKFGNPNPRNRITPKSTLSMGFNPWCLMTRVYDECFEPPSAAEWRFI